LAKVLRQRPLNQIAQLRGREVLGPGKIARAQRIEISHASAKPF